MPIRNYVGNRSSNELRNVRIGTAFPLDTTNMFQATTTVMEQAKSNLVNLLLNVPGERVNLPNFGVGLKRLLFENQIDSNIIESQIKEQSKYYIPNIDVTRVNISLLPDDNTMHVTVQFRSIYDNTPDSIQINFN